MWLHFPETPGHMHVARVLADTGASIFIVLLGFGILATLAVYAIVIVLEAMVMRYLEWDTFLMCLFDSWIINTVSIIAGIGLVAFSIDRPSMLIRLSELTITFPGLLIAFIGAWAITVGIEGTLLWAIRRRPALTTWRMIVIINAASYIVLVILYQILSRLL